MVGKVQIIGFGPCACSPLGAGFTYGQPPNSAQTAAVDVYDFLQKIYVLYPHLAKNKLVLASGSHRGMYTPHTATVIHRENLALASGGGEPGARHIFLVALIVSNPLSARPLPSIPPGAFLTVSTRTRAGHALAFPLDLGQPAPESDRECVQRIPMHRSVCPPSCVPRFTAVRA